MGTCSRQAGTSKRPPVVPRLGLSSGLGSGATTPTALSYRETLAADADADLGSSHLSLA